MNNSVKTKHKIRIGNDVKLDVCLSKQYISDTINIKSIKCALINTTIAFELKDDCHCHHDHCDKCIHDHRPTACSLHSCGHRCYHCDPRDWEYINSHRHFCEGYGQPERLCYSDHSHCHGPHHHYHPCVCHHGQLSLIRPCKPCDKHCNCMIPPHHEMYHEFFTDFLHPNTTLHHDLDVHPIMPFEYYPEVISTPERNRFFIMYPANDQRFIGNYTLVVTAEVYEPGYNNDNIRTITIDYPNIFELVEYTCQADNDVVISVGTPNENNVDYICACGPTIDRVLKGNAGILTAKVMPTSAPYRDVVWSNPTGGIDLLNKEGEVLQYVAKCCDIESGEETFKVRASSKYFTDKYVDFDITVFNYAKEVVVSASDKYALGDVLPYNESTTFNPEVVMQNGERISYYRKNNQVKSATTVTGALKDDKGVTLAIITDNGSGTYTIKNRNPYNEERLVRVQISSNIPSEDGTILRTFKTFNLAGQPLDVYGGFDKFIKIANYQDESFDISMNRSDGNKVTIDLNEAVGWTNK